MIGIKVKTDDKYAYVTMNYRHIIENNWLDDLKYLCEPTEFHEKRITVKFILSRSIAQEYTRHRVFSFAMESQRYCNYNRNKFGNEVTFIIPCWTSIEEGRYSWEEYFGVRTIDSSSCIDDQFIAHLICDEKNYFELLNQGWKPQQAREVLPNACKTELVMTGFVSDWEHFFLLRSNKYGKGGAHPSADELATPLYEEFVARDYINDLN